MQIFFLRRFSPYADCHENHESLLLDTHTCARTRATQAFLREASLPRRISSFVPQALSNMLWSFATMRYMPEGLIDELSAEIGAHAAGGLLSPVATGGCTW